MTPDYPAARRATGMGRPAHLPKSADPSDLTFAVLLEKWKTVPLRLAATAVAIVAFFLVPAAQAGSRSAFQTHLARALHARHVSPGRDGRDRLRPADRQHALRPQPAAAAQARVEREARHDVRGPERARPLLPNRDRRARRGAAERNDLAGEPRAQGIRRSRALVRPGQLARAPGGCGRDQARERPDPRRRELVRHAPHRARLEARRSTSTSRRPSRRSSSTVAGRDGTRRGGPR